MIRRHWPWLGLVLLLLSAWLAYRPGLAGGFVFDDFINLPALGAMGPVDDWPTFWRYLTSGTADPTGRPLALLSFLADARDWPADPAPFLRSNVLLHLLNGGLLFLLLRALGRRLDGDTARTDAAALLGAGAWLLHPLLVSTTLYIVQREAMLPATFTLLGLLAYVHGRGRLADAPRAGAAWMVGGIVLGTALATSSKANGLLLPLLAWVLDATVLRGNDARHGPAFARRLRGWRAILLVAPSLVVFAYLLRYLPRLGADLASRPWTIGERLLTEPRVLLDYLQLLAVPRTLSTGVYNDAYAASTGLLQPMATLPALLAIVGLCALGFAVRRRAPALAAGLLFFFAGHLLESSVVPLELYFEHRNYLPAMLLFWPLARAVMAWRVDARLRGIVAFALLGLLATITWQRAWLWGQPEQMALLWAMQNPESSRAQATAASAESKSGRPDLALRRLEPLWRAHPDDLQLGLNHANAACAVRGLAASDIEAIGFALRHADHGDQLVHRWLERALGVARNQRCRGLDLATVAYWIEQAGQNPLMARRAGRRQDLHSLRGRVALLRGKPATALASFDRALAELPTPRAAAMQAALLATHGHYHEALSHLDTYERVAPEHPRPARAGMRRVHAWVLSRQQYWPRELAVLRRKLEAEIAAQPVPAGRE